jgi:hypothetical protein
MEGEDSTRGLCRSCPQALPPAPGRRSSDQADVAAISRIRQPEGPSHRPARATITTSSPRLRWSTDDQAGEFQSWRGPLYGIRVPLCVRCADVTGVPPPPDNEWRGPRHAPRSSGPPRTCPAMTTVTREQADPTRAG